MYDLTAFTEHDARACRSLITDAAKGARSMEAFAATLVRDLHRQLIDPTTGQPSCALIRFYKTHYYDRLTPDLQAIARARADLPSLTGVKCLTLLATAGDQPAWNDRRASVGHQVFPLPSEAMVNQLPMMAQMFKQFGLKLQTLLNDDPQLLLDSEHRTYNVFYVADARGSAYIPAQEQFVIPYGIKSVLGFGGVLPYGELFAAILFSKTPIPSSATKHFESLALALKLALAPFVGNRTFA